VYPKSRVNHFQKINDAVDWIDATFGQNLKIATPLGLGKPNPLLNEIYTRVKNNKARSLKLYTALSLQIPHPQNDLEKRFVGPFSERHFGKDYPELLYARDLARNQSPDNVHVYEFYVQAGAALGHLEMQRHYMSVNYTHVAQAIFELQVPLIVMMVAKHPTVPGKYSLSCNPDLTLDLASVYQKNGKRMQMLGVVHPGLPFMTEDAEVDESFFDGILESDELPHEIFALAREPVTPAEFLIGLRASMLMPDDGTLQVGIGSLGDALTHALILRHKNPEVYACLTRPLFQHQANLKNRANEFHSGAFAKGIYGTSEMVMDAFMHLAKAGILKREIMDSDDKIRRYLHGAFFLGSKEFYQWMRERLTENDHGLCMTRVSKVNDLYDAHELAIRRQRKNARFYNMCLEITLLGGIASDTLSNGQVISGVGGQYNFVSMSHELPDSHSVILFHSFHVKNGEKISNINWGQEQLTIPRHLRDVFITEYGFSFTRGLTDEEVICANLEIADAEFQESLRETAIRNGKISPSYQIPKWATNNTEDSVAAWMKPNIALFPTFPFGSDFTPIEEKLVLALGKIKAALPFKTKLFALILTGAKENASHYEEALVRMNLKNPKTISERIYRLLVMGSLAK
jgi:acyl-CoA hydrolase